MRKSAPPPEPVDLSSVHQPGLFGADATDIFSDLRRERDILRRLLAGGPGFEMMKRVKGKAEVERVRARLRALENQI